MQGFGISSPCLRHPNADGKSSTGIIDNENLYRVGGSLKRLRQAEDFLWKGNVAAAQSLFVDCRRHQADNFHDYLERHRHRIINYHYYVRHHICSVGSGAVESTIKQINRRIQLSGAQWNRDNVPQVLAHRCAYLNRLIA